MILLSTILRVFRRILTFTLGEVGIAINGIFPEPLTSQTEDIEACRRCHDFTWGWFAHPIFHGNYPKRMIDTIGKRSQSEGRITSRLPEFTKEEIELIKGMSFIYLQGMLNIKNAAMVKSHSGDELGG